MRFNAEVRRKNVLRLSTESCSECVTMEAFYESNPLVFVLFFEHALLSSQHYKEAIVAGFHATCESLRWSRVACGLVDLLTDRPYGARYIDPKTAPAHLVVRAGEPIMTPKEHLQKLLKKPGDKDTILWHLREVLVDEGSLDVSVELADSSALDKFAARYQVVIVAVCKDLRLKEAFRAAAQEALLKERLPLQVPLEPQPRAKGKRKQQELRAALQRARVTFVALRSSSSGAKAPKGRADWDLTEGSVTALVAGERVAARELPLRSSVGDAAVLDALVEVGLKALAAANKTAPPKATAEQGEL